ncbi:MAG: TetR/AcrR family transcriptional regulator [Acidimicrobiales bacterium]
MSREAFQIAGRRSESHRAKGRVALTRADIVRAGAQLLDGEGLDGLSMRKLAALLGTGPATLYWHVRDKNELLALILDETIRPVQIPTSGPWDERLRAVLAASRQVLLPRPVLVRFIWEAGWNLGAETLRVADGLTGLVADSGLPDDEVADAYFGLITFLFGFVLAETATAGHDPFGTAPTDDTDRYPHLLRYGPATDAAGMDRRFRYGVDRAIEGIEARASERHRR